MIKYNPKVTMPDENTDVLVYFDKEYGFAVAHREDSDWYDSWSGYLMSAPVEYWVDLDDIKDSLK